MASNKVSNESNKTLTPGELKRQQREQARAQQKKQEQTLGTIKRIQKEQQDKYMALYKERAVKAFVKVFGDNYGANLDYDSLKNAITFYEKKTRTGDFEPNIQFDASKIKFKSDINKTRKEFNENSYQNFISNHDQINGAGLNQQDFDSIKQYEQYEEIQNKDLQIETIQNEFLPTSDRDKERYSNFNRLNKKFGFATIENSRDAALKLMNTNGGI